VVGTAVKAKIGELEEEVRVGSSRRMRMELTGVVIAISGKRKFLVRFHDGCEKNLSSNQLTVVTPHEILVEEAPLVSTIPVIPEDKNEGHKGYYVSVYVILQFKTEDEFDNKEEQMELEIDPDEEEKDDIKIDDERERHWRNVFEDNEGGVDEKAKLHAKRWDLYLHKKDKLVQSKYSVEVVGHDKKKVIWEVIGDHEVEEPSDHEEIGLRGFDFKIFDQDEEVSVREEICGPYLKMLIKLWPGDWVDQLKRINKKVDEDNEMQRVKGIVRFRKVRRFSSSEFWRNIGCMVSAPTFGLGGQRLWEKEEDQKLSGKKRKRRSIRAKVDLYEVCFLFYFLCSILF